jgi:indole-3-glycerol phosphate synthase
VTSKDFLSKITDIKKEEIKTLYTSPGLDFFKNNCKTNIDNNHSFYEALSTKGLNLIAEIKKASPSKGIIRKDFNPVLLANTFQNLGAACLSILTEIHFFQGKPEYISNVKEKTNLPILRKDFILDPIQIYQSKYLGANAILLIKAILPNNLCQELVSLAKELDLDILLEIHTKEELEETKKLSGIKIIGINNRDLHSFKVDIELAPQLLTNIREYNKDICVIAESGYSTQTQLEALNKQGFNGVLIGEGLAKNPDIFSTFCNKEKV